MAEKRFDLDAFLRMDALKSDDSNVQLKKVYQARDVVAFRGAPRNPDTFVFHHPMAGLYGSAIEGLCERSSTADRNTFTESAYAWGLAAAMRRGLSGSNRHLAFPVNALPREGIQLKRPPLWVGVLQDAEDYFIAEVPEVGAVGYGESAAEAVENVIDDLCNNFDEFAKCPDEELGPLPRKWKTSFSQMVEETSVSNIQGPRYSEDV